MIISASMILAWLVCIFSALLLKETLEKTRGGQKMVFLSILAVFTVALLRPHEDILGGDDHGAYLNASASYLRNDAFKIKDELLERVEPEVRDDFLYYGHGSGVRTPFHALRLPGDGPETSPWFQIGFPLLLAAGMRLGGSATAALYVTPILAIMTGIAVSALAGTLFRRKGAETLAMTLYLSNPLVFWHARYVRAEIPAAFFVVAGLVFFFRSLPRTSRGTLYLVLSAVAFGLSVFMHATAWLIVLPVAFVAGFHMMAGRKKYLGFLLIVALFGWGFVFQMAYIVDWYGVRNLCRHLIEWALPLNVALGLGLSAAYYSAKHKPFSRIERTVRRNPRFWGAWILGLAGAAFLATARLSSEGARFFGLLNFTDLSGFVGLVSWPIVFMALVGWAGAVFYPSDRSLGMRRGTLMLLLPGVCFGYVVSSYMYGARYFVLYQTTLLVLGLSAFCVLTGRWIPRLQSVLPRATCFLLVAAQLAFRPHLYVQTDFKGLADFYENLVAANRLDENSLLLVEYSRIGTPLKHCFGIPALGLDNEFTLDYGDALRNWREIMRQWPARDAYFLTPFHYRPQSEYFTFEEVWQGRYAGDHLARRRHGVPTRIVPWKLEPTLYRMRLREASPRSPVPRISGEISSLPVGEGNMGFRDFAFCVEKDAVSVSGRPVEDDAFLEVPIAPNEFSVDTADLWWIFLNRGDLENPPKTVTFREDGIVSRRPLHDMGGGWLGAYSERGENVRELAIRASEGSSLLLTQTLGLGSNPSGRMWMTGDPRAVQVEAPGFVARWACRNARLLAPSSLAGGHLLLFAVVPSEIEGEVELKVGSERSSPSHTMAPGVWQWVAFPIGDSESDRALTELTFRTDHVLNLRHRGREYPMMLLIGRMVLRAP